VSSYKSSCTYGAEEIRRFLRAVDQHLTSATSVVIIGGAAAALHDAMSTTSDVDTNDAMNEDLQHAIKQAGSETGLAIPMNHSPVADVPWNFQDRLERRLPELGRLEVWVLEKHDLALSKTVRGAEHDEQQIQEIHRSVGLDYEVLGVLAARVREGSIGSA